MGTGLGQNSFFTKITHAICGEGDFLFIKASTPPYVKGTYID